MRKEDVSPQEGFSRRVALRAVTGGLVNPNNALRALFAAISRIEAADPIVGLAISPPFRQAAAKAVIEGVASDAEKNTSAAESGLVEGVMGIVPSEWEGYHRWIRQLDFDIRIEIRGGQWPEETPPEYRELYGKLTEEEKLLGMTGRYPKIDRIRRRTVEDARILEAKQERAQLIRRARQPRDTRMSNDELKAEAERRGSGGMRLHEEIDEILSSLSPLEGVVIKGLFGLKDGVSKTAEQLALQTGNSVEKINQIESSALGKLREPVRRSRIALYLE